MQPEIFSTVSLVYTEMFGLGIAEVAFRFLFCFAEAEAVVPQHDTWKGDANWP